MSSAEAALALSRAGLLLAESVVFGTLVLRVLAGHALPSFGIAKAWLSAAWLSPRGIAVVPAAFAMGLHAASGHATANGDLWLQMFVVAHVLAAGEWIGGLPALWVALDGADQSGLVWRFARLGLARVLVLSGTATLQGLDLASGLPGLAGTEYGHLLLLKLACTRAC